MTWVLVPAKDWGAAKSRLRDHLDPEQRQRLAHSMLEHVLAVLACTSRVQELWLITDSAEVAEVGRGAGATLLADPAIPAPIPARLGPVVAHGLRQMRRRGAQRVAVLMGDLPLLTVADVDQWLAHLDTHDAALAADRPGRGTNGLALGPRAPIISCFGHEDSLRRHQQQLSADSLRHHTLHRRGLSHDVDTPADLSRYASFDRSRARSVNCM